MDAEYRAAFPEKGQLVLPPDSLIVLFAETLNTLECEEKLRCMTNKVIGCALMLTGRNSRRIT